MALASDLCFSLLWTTERPYLDRARQSSFFRMSGEEWYLRLSLRPSQYPGYTISLCLHRRNGAKVTNGDILAKCITIVENRAYYSFTCLPQDSGYEIFRSNIPTEQVNVVSSHSKNWMIICSLSWNGPHSLQINNKRIHLSTVDHANHPPKFIDKSVQVSQVISQDTDSLSSDISSLLEEEVFPDFRLECGGQIFPVHQSILAARSEVFRAMFRNRMLESETRSTCIEDLEVPVLESLLKFIYSGKLDQVSDDTLPKIYKASDKYAVHSLKTACCHLMKSNLSEENCVSFLDVTEFHCDHELKAAVVSFILKHPTVLKSTTWLAYSVAHPETGREVLQNYISATIQ